MERFDKQQKDIVIATDRVKNDGRLSKQEKNKQYIDIMAGFIEKYVPVSLKLVKPPFSCELLKEFSLLLIKNDAQLDAQNSYPLSSIVAAIEIHGHGWVEKANDLEDAIKRKQACFEQIWQKYSIKCLYLTLEERRKTKEGTSYHALSKKHMGSHYFSLRDSTTKMLNPHEWEQFINSIQT